MTTSMFIILFTACSVITGLCTEAAKKMLDEIPIKYSANILALIMALIVGVGGTSAYYVYNSIAFTNVNILTAILMGVAVSVGAMVGYDKVKQAIAQIME